MADRKRESNQIGYLASNGRDLYLAARRRGCNGSGDALAPRVAIRSRRRLAMRAVAPRHQAGARPI